MKFHSHNILSTLFFAALCCLSPALAYAEGLDNAKADGWVGETANGYAGLVKATAPAAVRQQVPDVNTRRRGQYERIAKQNGIRLQPVELLTGKKAIQKTAAGGWIKLNGAWQQK